MALVRQLQLAIHCQIGCGRLDLGEDCVGVTPVPIPNTAVKPYDADDTAAETRWESRYCRGRYMKKPVQIRAFFMPAGHRPRGSGARQTRV